jgi:hypothetical protein
MILKVKSRREGCWYYQLFGVLIVVFKVRIDSFNSKATVVGHRNVRFDILD